MLGLLIGLGLSVFLGVLLWFFTPLTYIKKGHLVVKLMGKKTSIPISDIQKIKAVDMLRSGYQIEIYTKNETFYGRIGKLDGFSKRIHMMNPNVVVEERSIS